MDDRAHEGAPQRLSFPQVRVWHAAPEPLYQKQAMLYCCGACRGLEGMLAERKSLLQYLRRTQFDTYSVLIARLGLKDSFAKQVCFAFAVAVHLKTTAGLPHSCNSMTMLCSVGVQPMLSVQDRFSVRSKAQRR